MLHISQKMFRTIGYSKKKQKLKFQCPNCRDELPLKEWKEKVNYNDNRKKEAEFMNKINEYEKKII